MPFDYSARESNFKVIQGDSFLVDVYYKDPSGSAIVLTDYTALLEVRDKPGGSILCCSASIGDGITVTASAGQLSINLTPEKTRKFTHPRAAYQLHITSPSAVVTTLLNGWFTVDPGVIN